jgi:hypothetical protein
MKFFCNYQKELAPHPDPLPWGEDLDEGIKGFGFLCAPCGFLNQKKT